MRFIHRVIPILVLLLVLDQASAQNVRSWRIGDATDVTTNHNAGIVLAGGATDNDAAMSWLLTKAAGGDVVVLRASGSDGYNAYLYGLGPAVNSVETFLIDSRSKAGSSTVAQAIRNAEALFIAGGDQADYVSFWNNTAVGDAINYLIQTKGVAVGGTSAGCAIQGDVYFSAINGTVTSATALANPYASTVTLGRGDFITHTQLTNTITDTHYDNPDRRGRHMAFLARMATDWGIDARGIGVEEYTAVCIEPNGTARVFGAPSYDDNAYFLQAYGGNPENCTAGSPLTWNQSGQAVKVYKLKGDVTGNQTFDLNSWTSGNGGAWQDFYVVNGSLSVSSPASAPSNRTCPSPSAPATTAITATSAMPGWSDAAGTGSYELRYRVVGSTSWISQNTAGTSLSLTGLTAATDYEWQVRSLCSAVNSAYTASAGFTTLASSGGDRPTYCPASGSNTGSEYIDLVDIRNLYNQSGDDGGYGDYTSTGTALEAGQSYSIYLRPGFPGTAYRENWRVWIDFNRDGDYADAGELLFSTRSRRAFSRTVTIPSNALNGPTGMRVAMQYNSYPDPCDQFRDGEVEDYTVTITAGQNRLGAEAMSSPVGAIYPNPASNRLVVSGPVNELAEYKIYQADGRLLSSHIAEGQVSLDISRYKPGVYLLQITIGSKQTSEQFLIAR